MRTMRSSSPRAILLVLALGALPGCAILPLREGKAPMAAAPTPVVDKGGLPGKEASAACLNVARALEGEGHYAEAVLQLELARKHDPRQPVARRLAVLHARLGNKEKAQAEFEAALKIGPPDADLLNDLGYFHLRQGDAPGAEKHFRQALVHNPELQKAWVNLGLALAEQGRDRESLDAFTHVVSPAAAHANLGVVQLRGGRNEPARVSLSLALKLDPGLEPARQALGYLEKGSFPILAQTAGETAIGIDAVD